MADMMECVDEMELALRHLSNEVEGCWSAYQADLRQMMGHTNYTCVTTRIAEARVALARYEDSK